MAEPTPTENEANDPLKKALEPNPVEKFVEENSVLLLGALIGVIVLVSLTILFRGLGEARQTARAQAFTEAESVEDYESVATKFSGTVVGGNALIRKAELLEEDGNVEEARTTYDNFLAKYSQHPRKSQVLVTLGRMDETAGDLESARSYYEQVAADSEHYNLAQLHLGDILMQEEKYEEAKQHFTLLEQPLANTIWVADLNNRLDLATRRAEFGPPSPPRVIEEEKKPEEPVEGSEGEEKVEEPKEGDEKADPESGSQPEVTPEAEGDSTPAEGGDEEPETAEEPEKAEEEEPDNC